MIVALRHVRLIDGLGSVQERATVVIKDDRILAAGPSRSTTVPRGAVELDVRGMTVDEVPPPAAGAGAYTVARVDALAAARLAISLSEVAEVTLPVIEEALTERTERVIEIAQRHDIRVASPLDPDRRAGIVALVPDNVAALGAELANRGVTITARSGIVRVSPHVGTDDETLGLLEEACAAYAQQR